MSRAPFPPHGYPMGILDYQPGTQVNQAYNDLAFERKLERLEREKAQRHHVIPRPTDEGYALYRYDQDVAHLRKLKII